MEIEIKLGPLEPEPARRGFADAELLPLSGPESRIRMHTVYYDNDRGFFAASRLTLRLRQENDRRVCTFKQKAAGLGRLELEYPCADLAEGIARLAEDPALPEGVRQELALPLHPVCGAAFVRRTRVVEACGGAFDLCLDEGVLENGPRREPFCELELEVRQGDEAALRQLARRLTDRYDLPICTRSKQQRALELGGDGR